MTITKLTMQYMTVYCYWYLIQIHDIDNNFVHEDFTKNRFYDYYYIFHDNFDIVICDL